MKCQETKQKRRMILAAVILLIIFCAVSAAMIPLIRLLSSEEGQSIITAKMKSFGIFAPLLFILLQVAQVVIAIIPGGPVPIIGGLLFGEVAGLLLSIVGFFIGTVIVYYLVQRFGRPVVSLFVSEEKLQKYAYLASEKKLEIFVFLIFFLPGLPKDALTYIVSFSTKIKPMRLFVITTVARTPAAFLSVWLGGSIWDGKYWLSVCFIAAMFVLAIFGYFVKRKLDQKK